MRSRILAQGYTLRSLGSGSRAPLGPMVVGAADLYNRAIVALLKRSYQAGNTVSITNATAAAAARLQSLVGDEAGASWAASIPEVSLFSLPGDAVGRTTPVPDECRGRSKGGPRADGPEGGGKAARRRGHTRGFDTNLRDPADRAREPFSEHGANLTTLAVAYESSSMQSDSLGDTVQLTNWVYGARSFQNQADLYYVLQE